MKKKKNIPVVVLFLMQYIEGAETVCWKYEEEPSYW
jgi:hypothetical protein